MLVLVLLLLRMLSAEEVKIAQEVVNPELNLIKNNSGVSDNSYAQRNVPTSERFGKILTFGTENLFQEDLPEIKAPPLSERGKRILKRFRAEIAEFQDGPVAILIDDTPEMHYDANVFMKNLLKFPDVKAKFALMIFDNSGVSGVLVNTTNKEDFIDALKLCDNNQSMKTTTELTPTLLKGSVLFYAILTASKLLPEDSGIVVFTYRQTADEDLALLAWTEMMKQRIKLFVVWGGVYPTTRYEETLFLQATILSGGDFYIADERNSSDIYSDDYLNTFDATQTKALVAVFTNITDSGIRSFPVDSGVTSIHISMTFPGNSAWIFLPGDSSMLNLLNSSAVSEFSMGSFSTLGPNGYDIQLNTATRFNRDSVGIWTFFVEGKRPCNISVSVQTQLNIRTSVTDKVDVNPGKPTIKDVLTVAVSGKFTKINNITLVDQWGYPIQQNIHFKKSKDKESLTENNITTDKKDTLIYIDLDNLPHKPFYVKMFGEDKDGTTFSRLSYFDKYQINYQMQPLNVEVGAGSELLLMPNNYGKIFFEVTSYRDQVLYLYFKVQDEKSHLFTMEPKSAWLNPKQTVVVTITTYVGYVPTTSDYKNTVTFTASGPEKIQKRATMYVSSNRVTDNWEPRLTHTYSSHCRGVSSSSCHDSSWVIEVTAEDKNSGLMQLSSNPKGLNFREDYVAGTKEPVTAIYSGSCCQSQIRLTAIDLSNNRASYTADACYAALSAGLISAIVLGCLLLVLILIVVAFFCRKKYHKKQSVDLPKYLGPHQYSRPSALFYINAPEFMPTKTVYCETSL